MRYKSLLLLVFARRGLGFQIYSCVCQWKFSKSNCPRYCAALQVAGVRYTSRPVLPKDYMYLDYCPWSLLFFAECLRGVFRGPALETLSPLLVFISLTIWAGREHAAFHLCALCCEGWLHSGLGKYKGLHFTIIEHPTLSWVPSSWNAVLFAGLKW